MKPIHLIISLCLFLSALCTAKDNLLSGDSDVEREITSMTSGPWTNSFPAAPKWAWDNSVGYKSKSSVRMFKFCGVGIPAITLPAGKYTFSFWARSSKNGVMAHIAVLNRDTTWHEVLKRRKAGIIYIKKNWQRYSCSFVSDGRTALVPYFGSGGNDTVWVDRFMINIGATAAPWSPSYADRIEIDLPPADGQVFDFDKQIPVKISIFSRSQAGKSTPYPLNIAVINHFNRKVLEKSVPIVFNPQGKADYSFQLPGGQSAWYKITAGVANVGSARQTLVTLRPPEKTGNIPPFVGLYRAQDHIAVAKKIGIGWLDLPLDWREIEPAPGKYDFSSMDRLVKLKKQGFRIKLMICSSSPSWLLSPDIVKAATAAGTMSHRLLPPADQLETRWRAMISAFARKYAEYVDIFELGGELDALIGLATYYKNLAPEQNIGKFAGGTTLNRLCHQLNIAAQEIIKVKPDAAISAVRPSDVDARYAYIYSKAIFKQCGKYINCFGIDCYPQPRWIGPNVPPTGTEQQLRIRYRNALSAMKKYCKGRDIFISEYGYFVDVNEILNPEYLIIRANRLSRSYLLARALGMKSLFYYSGGNCGLEGKRYHMGIWFGTMPLPGIVALSTVAGVVNNVRECKQIPFNSRTGVIVYNKADNRAVAALWSIDAAYSPLIRIPYSAGLEFRDIMGNPINPTVNGKTTSIRLNSNPIYIWSNKPGKNNYAALLNILRHTRLEDTFPLDIRFRLKNTNTLNIHLRSSATVSGKLNYPGGSRPFSLNKGQEIILSVPRPPKCKKTAYRVKLDGQATSHIEYYTPPETVDIIRRNNIKCDGSLDSWKGIVPLKVDGADHIMPIDHTTYTGSKDLSADIYLAHDNKYLYVAVSVQDDLQKKGDCLKLGFDPLNNYTKSVNGCNWDDCFVTLFSNGKLETGHGNKTEKTQKWTVKVTRKQDTRSTLYQLKIPLNYIHSDRLRPGVFFGFNCVVMDDDTNSGADYWLFLRPGLAGELRPDYFMQGSLK